MNQIATLEEIVTKLEGMECAERYMSTSEMMPKEGKCVHMNTANDLKAIRIELGKMLEELLK